MTTMISYYYYNNNKVFSYNSKKVVAEYSRPAELDMAMLVGLSCLSQLESWHAVVYHNTLTTL